MVLTNDNILTIGPEGMDNIILQYHPSALSMSEKSNAQSMPGLDSVITFIPPKETSSNTINITGYLTALVPARDEIGVTTGLNTDLIAGGAAALALTALSAGGRVVLDTLDAAASVISLAKGVYNIADGIISDVVLNPSPIGLADDHIKKLQLLAKVINEGTPCQLSWDIAFDVFPTNEYVVTAMDITVEDIQEETGATMIIKVDLSLIKHGTRIEVL